MRSSALALCLGLALLALAGCDKNKPNEGELLTDENSALRKELDERNAALEASENERRNLAMRLSELERNATTQPATATPAAGSSGFEGVEGADISYEQGKVRVAIASDVLFDSGRATLKASAKRALDEVARVLNTRYADKAVVMQGFTDTDPIVKSGFKSNYHLGFDRAYSVREYLISRGVSASRIEELASFGPNQPKDTKAKSRRVEVVVDES
jgi:chemotaxis protein MotB